MNDVNIALAALRIGAIKLSPEKPFTWASGYQMPIYNDNRMFLAFPNYRKLITESFMEKTEENATAFDFIAGTSTAGIPWATLLADRSHKPMIYVRDKPKDHGLQNQIEGIDASSNLGGQKVALIEDLVSTGGSSVKAVEAIRKANGLCNYCFSVFDYGFEEADKLFDSLKPKCRKNSLLTYDTLIDIALGQGYIDDKQEEMLREWRLDPFGWGEKRGFGRVEKK